METLSQHKPYTRIEYLSTIANARGENFHNASEGIVKLFCFDLIMARKFVHSSRLQLV